MEPAPLWARAAVEQNARPSANVTARFVGFQLRNACVRILAKVFIPIGSLLKGWCFGSFKGVQLLGNFRLDNFSETAALKPRRTFSHRVHLLQVRYGSLRCLTCFRADSDDAIFFCINELLSINR